MKMVHGSDVPEGNARLRLILQETHVGQLPFWLPYKLGQWPISCNRCQVCNAHKTLVNVVRYISTSIPRVKITGHMVEAPIMIAK